MMAKKILIFGSTGSIGKSALDVAWADKKNFSVLGLCANSDTAALLEQVKKYNPKYVCIVDEQSALKIKSCLPKGVVLFSGLSGLDEFSSIKADISVMAISGIACLRPLYRNIEYVKHIALANKEAVVAAGDLIFNKAKKFSTKILPVDSEINSLYQLLEGEKQCAQLYLTASGGALYEYSPAQLKKVTAAQVLAHPTWKMGKRITVDSATLVNKAFEVIETNRFFGIDYDDIDVVVHRQSYVHAILRRQDGTFFMCVYPPDMKMPIAHAMYHPHTAKINNVPDAFDKNLLFTFEPLNMAQFPGFSVVLDAAKKGGNYLAAINACDEVAVEAFLSGKICFMDIVKILEYVYQRLPCKKVVSVEDILYWDNRARQEAVKYLEQ